ncbi:MAG: CoA activase [Deltaproteobacteria bacterium]|nr:CoA activase [Deltaproteobacteria bacterium]
MLVAGVDLGSATGKAVILKDGDVVGTHLAPSNAHPVETAKSVMARALEEAGLDSIDHIESIITTGYGRLKVPFASENISEITCHAKGAQWSLPSVRTVIDIGGQDCKVISVTPKGMVGEFQMNDRCAAGTGRFFEGIARGLGCGLEGISDLANQGEEPCTISNQCSVFAESEVVTLVNEGMELRNIISGVNLSVAKRLKAMVRRIGVVEDVAMTGGCSKNDGLSKALEELLGVEIKRLPFDPQLNGALGAALMAQERLAARQQAEQAGMAEFAK